MKIVVLVMTSVNSQVIHLHKHVQGKGFVLASMWSVMISRELFPVLCFWVNSISCLTGFCKGKDNLEKVNR